jgi:integrase
VWWVQYSHRGTVVRESSGSGIRAEAAKLLKRRLGEIGQGRLIGPDVERTTFEDLARMLLDDYAMNGRKSTNRAAQSLAHLREFFGLSRALDITGDRITAYVKHRQGESAFPATIRNELAALKRAFNLGRRAGRVDRPPFFPTITVNNTRSGFFEEPEFRAVLAGLPAEVQPVAEFMYLTGWRKSEVLGLTWAQVDMRAGVIRLEPGTTKNREGRVLPFHALPALADLMAQQRAATSAVEQARVAIVPHVFHRQGEGIRDFRRAWLSACKAAGLVNRIPHDFRRTAVRNMERAGVSRSVAMKVTGHKTESVYKRYAIVSEADMSEGLAKLAKLDGSKDAAPTVVPFKVTK